MEADPDSADVKAAGGVVVRREAGEARVALCHRPRYDDWSFPKGKLDPGETWEQAALREVEEEIGLRCGLGDELPPTSYQVPRGPQGRALLADGAAVRRVRAQRGGRRDALGDARRGRGPAELRARSRPRARAARVNRDRFPGLRDGWARLDGPAGTQMVDVAIDAMTEWMRSGRGANSHGAFAAAEQTDELVDVDPRRGRDAVRRRARTASCSARA